jgi:hypothetical protein
MQFVLDSTRTILMAGVSLTCAEPCWIAFCFDN